MKSRLLTGLLISCLAWTAVSAEVVQAEDDAKKAREKLEEIRSKKEKAEGKGEEIADQMDKVQEKIDQIGREIHQRDQRIHEVEKSLEKVQARLDKKMDRYKGRLKHLYQNGEVGYMTSLFESESLSQFLARFETFRLMVKEDHHLVEQVEKDKQQILKQKKRLSDLNQQRTKKMKEAKHAYEKLQKLKENNKEKLAEIRQEEQIQEAEVREMNLLALKNGTFQYPGGPFHWPGDSHRITSDYGYRVHPVTGVHKLHTGIDTAGDAGDPIYAAADGIVLDSRPASGYGWIIMIDHGSSLTTLYAHMYPHTVRVQKGDYVERGQQIAEIGDNGYSTGPHNHFEVRKNGTLQDPKQYLQ
ncbi:Murein DD-endopeptidase MepM and murein hydrolase activator NlpD, contain LysM domain [Melghirimyces thermohalophilus]|uniref:Murein DD-endopeptidase MepM and murein hydrolase activator NlpD, contain LysM domain n=1 Tax=Melghirimyces thermohalophilus TaxID=1236220 RepID=A0A1G6QT01_9BACL|nr:M23 family metallopeptidase [Melghirimyces thermohalophilus]SDC94827.1 Murein DD-endopeptidase MepM and murein hydrolase activator NlpD, contain LysM domain [Melghirimyces thermohalophilus]